MTNARPSKILGSPIILKYIFLSRATGSIELQHNATLQQQQQRNIRKRTNAPYPSQETAIESHSPRGTALALSRDISPQPKFPHTHMYTAIAMASLIFSVVRKTPDRNQTPRARIIHIMYNAARLIIPRAARAISSVAVCSRTSVAAQWETHNE